MLSSKLGCVIISLLILNMILLLCIPYRQHIQGILKDTVVEVEVPKLKEFEENLRITSPRPPTNTFKSTPLTCQGERDKLNLLRTLTEESVTSPSLFKVVMYPIQSACVNMKKLGGYWLGNGYDGGKYVCFDDFSPHEKCVIYSFGIAGDVSFENVMTELGCVIHAYDHSIKDTMLRKAKPSQGFYIHKMGIASTASSQMTTFRGELEKNQHLNSKITYLKMDIEGGERILISEWAKQGLLDNVLQIGLEFHDVKSQFLWSYLKLMQDLDKLGFKIISFDPNYYTGQYQRFMTYFEIVFRKVKTECE